MLVRGIIAVFVVWLIASDGYAQLAAKGRVDALGDPLPAGVIARLGTTRLHHSSYVYGATFSPDGKTIFSLGNTSNLWDATTGRLIEPIKTEHGFDYKAPVFSKDGKIAAASRPNEIMVWNVAARKLITTLRFPATQYILSIAIANDGKTLVAVGDDGTVRWYDVASSKELRLWKPREGVFQINKAGKKIDASGIWRAMLTRDATLLAVRGEFSSPQAVIYELTSGKELWRLDCGAFRFSQDGKQLVSFSFHNKGEIHVHDAVSGKLQSRLSYDAKARKFESSFLAISPDGQTVALGLIGPEVALWSTESRKMRLVRISPEHIWDSTSSSIVFSPDGKKLLIPMNHRLMLLDVATGKEALQFPGHREEVGYVHFSADGRHVLTGGIERLYTGAALEVLTWQIDSWKQSASSILDPEGPFTYVTPNHAIRLAGNSADPLALFSTNSGKRVGQLQLPEGVAPGPRTPFSFFSPAGKYFVIHSSGANVLEIPSGKLLWTGVGEICHFSPDEKLLAINDFDDPSVVKICETTTGKLLANIKEERTLHPNPPKSVVGGGIGEVPTSEAAVAISPNNKFMASWFPHRPDIWIWDLAKGTRVGILRGLADIQGRPKVVLCWSPDNRMLAVAGFAGNNIQLWEVSTGKIRRTLKGHEGQVNVLAFSPDSRLLASGSADTTVLIWDLSAR